MDCRKLVSSVKDVRSRADVRGCVRDFTHTHTPVSYTHLTLPTTKCV